MTRDFKEIFTKPLTALGPPLSRVFTQFINAPSKFRRVQLDYFGAADGLEPREIPEVWKGAALLRFNWLNGAVTSREEDALTAWLFLQREPVTVRR